MHEIEMFGIVGVNFTLAGFMNNLKVANGSEVSILINTAGGDVEQGLGIQSAIADYKGPTKGRIIGLAASVGSWAGLTCDSLEMNEHALMMIHECMQELDGYFNKSDLRKYVREMEKVDKNFQKMYLQKSNLSEAKINQLMHDEELINAEEALDYGFISRINPVTATPPSNIQNLLKSNKFQKSQDRLLTLANLGGSATNPRETNDLDLQIERQKTARLERRLQRKMEKSQLTQ